MFDPLAHVLTFLICSFLFSEHRPVSSSPSDCSVVGVSTTLYGSGSKYGDNLLSRVLLNGSDLLPQCHYILLTACYPQTFSVGAWHEHLFLKAAARGPQCHLGSFEACC